MNAAATRALALLLLPLLAGCGEQELDALRLGQLEGAVTEAGGKATFPLSLSRKPLGPVVLHLVSTDATEATVEPATLSFAVENWNRPQQVTVTGVDDAIADGRVLFSVQMTGDAPADAGFHQVVWNLPMGCADDDVAGISVTGPDSIAEGAQATLSIALTSEPTADVEVTLVIGDDSELIASPTSLIFTPANWATPQQLRLTALQDEEDDGDQAVTISLEVAVSADEVYATLDPVQRDVVVLSD